MSRQALLPLLALAVACALLGATAARAQTPVPSVSVSFGVDTTAADVGAIVRLVRAYLARPDTSAAARALWSPADSVYARSGDLHRGFAYQGFPATVLGVTSSRPGDGEYVVKVLYATAEDGGRQVMPLALQRLHAVRAPEAPHGWLLSSAISRSTAEWPVRHSGRIRYHYAPGQEPDPERAAQAAAFVDSVTAIFGVSPPERLEYYVTGSPDEYLRALGLDFFPLPSGRGTATGGQALAQQGVVLSGDPTQGEAYRHELVHAVLGRRIGGGALLGEGLPVWFGGSKGRSARHLYGVLVEFQHAHPEITLEALARGQAGEGPHVDDALHATGALFVEWVYRRRGLSGVRALLGAPNDAAGLLTLLTRHLGLPSSKPRALTTWWREAARQAAEGR